MTPPDADRVFREDLVVKWIEANWPTTPSDDSVCAHCRQRSDVLLPIGIKNHVWLHSQCWEPWRLALRRQAAIALGFADQPFPETGVTRP